jgi:hypothetical protein
MRPTDPHRLKSTLAERGHDDLAFAMDCVSPVCGDYNASVEASVTHVRPLAETRQDDELAGVGIITAFAPPAFLFGA